MSLPGSSTMKGDFWGVVVPAGNPVTVKPEEGRRIHVTQACLEKGENVLLTVRIDGNTKLIGTLSQKKIPQISLNLLFEKEFELSHNGDKGDVHFSGYKGESNLLTKADVVSSFGELIISWYKKNPTLICEVHVQLFDECWAAAFSGGIHALYKSKGIKKEIPEVFQLVKGIERYLTSTKSIDQIKYAVNYLKRTHGVKVTVHRRPSLESLDHHKEYEEIIESLLARCPVAVCFALVPSLDEKEDHVDDEIFRPNAVDLLSMRFENLEEHCALLTSHGVQYNEHDKTWVPFWEVQDGGFGTERFRLERRKRLITCVFEMNEG